MARTARTTARCGSAVAAAVLGLLTPSLVALPAAAAGPVALAAVEPLGHEGAGAAGTCLLYRVVPMDAAYEPAVTSSGAGFVTVTLAEVDDLTRQDVDFCTAGGRGDAFRTAPKYRSGHSAAPLTQYYNPGESLTPEEAANPVKARQDVAPAVTTTNPSGRPDVAAEEASTSGIPTNNLNGTDTATLAYDADAGGFVFGVVGLQEGAGRISAFFDKNGDGDADTAAPTPLEPGGDVHAQDTAVRLTSGGPPWSLSTANAVSTVEATPDAATALAGSKEGAPLAAVLRNAAGHVLAGVMPRVAAESGPNSGASPTWSGSCTATDGAGRAACSYAASRPGTDTVALWVNQSGTGRTAGRDAGEPHDVSVVDVKAPSSAAPTAGATASPSAVGSSSSPAAPATSAPSSPTAPATPSCQTASVDVERPVLTATEAGRVVVYAAPERAVRLLAYSRPSTTYRVVREGRTGSDGSATFEVRPLSNTRLYAEQVGCSAGTSQVLQVRPVLTLDTTRAGVRDIVFRGRVTPARSGQLVSLYRTASDGRAVLAGQRRVDGSGAWTLRRVFSGTGRFAFVARTGADLVNAAGSSRPRNVDVR